MLEKNPRILLEDSSDKPGPQPVNPNQNDLTGIDTTAFNANVLKVVLENPDPRFVTAMNIVARGVVGIHTQSEKGPSGVSDTSSHV